MIILNNCILKYEIIINYFFIIILIEQIATVDPQDEEPEPPEPFVYEED